MKITKQTKQNLLTGVDLQINTVWQPQPKDMLKKLILTKICCKIDIDGDAIFDVWNIQDQEDECDMKMAFTMF